MSLNDARMKKNVCLELWNHGHIFRDWVLAPRVGGTPMLGSLEEYLLVVGVLSGDHSVLKCLILKCKSLISLILYFCSWFRTKDAAERRWLFTSMKCWHPLLIPILGMVHMFSFFWLMPSLLSKCSLKLLSFPHLYLKICVATWPKIQRSKNVTWAFAR